MIILPDKCCSGNSIIRILNVAVESLFIVCRDTISSYLSMILMIKIQYFNYRPAYGYDYNSIIQFDTYSIFSFGVIRHKSSVVSLSFSR